MKALTVQQPWAWAVLSGRINFFMEPFPPKIRGYFLIHSGIAYDDIMHDWLERDGTVVPLSLPKVQLLGYARLLNVTTRRIGGPQPVISGRFVFTLADIERITPYVAAGRRGFWPVPRRMMDDIVLPDYVMSSAL